MLAISIKSFSGPSALEIHREAMTIARDIKDRYLKLFEILLVVEERQIYFEFDVPSLHTYCTELLEVSKDTAKNLIVVVRKSLEVPQLAEAVRSRKLTIPKARKICSVINESNCREWIELAIHCSCRDVEKAVAMANPKEAVVESAKYVSGDVLEFRAGVSEEWIELLAAVKDLVSQKKQTAVTGAEAIFLAMSEYRKRNDPVEKAKRASARIQKRNGLLSAETAKCAPTDSPGDIKIEAKLEKVSRDTNSRHRPAVSEHAVNLRDQGQCVHVDSNGRRCSARRWLNKHHIDEFARGGDHRPENLETLCWAHHKIKHLKEKKASRDAFKVGESRLIETRPSALSLTVVVSRRAELVDHVSKRG